MSKRVENKMIDAAILLAVEMHKGQRDKANQPYIFHPFRVMQEVYDLGEDYACAAILHDTLEDTALTVEQLRDYDFSQTVIDAVVALTHNKEQGETYEQFIYRCKKNTIAKAVKYQDIMDNMSRMNYFESDLKVAELRNKYKWAAKELNR